MMRNMQWWRKKSPSNFVVIVVESNGITGMRFINQAVSSARASLKLDAQWHHVVEGVGFSTSLLDKPSALTAVGSMIKASGVDVKNTCISVVMHTHHLHEKWYLLDHASPKKEDFSFTSRGQSTWSFQYLYPIGHQQHAFYVCEVEQAVAFQYASSLMKVGIVPVLMTSRALALMHAYHFYQGAAFRRTQFALDMAACEYQIDRLVSLEMVHRLVSIDPMMQGVQDHSSALAVSVGVVLGMIHHEMKGLL